LSIIWQLLANGELYQDLGANYFESHNTQVKPLSRRIVTLGFEVTVTERIA
jgi:hypothetical protein